MRLDNEEIAKVMQEKRDLEVATFAIELTLRLIRDFTNEERKRVMLMVKQRTGGKDE